MSGLAPEAQQPEINFVGNPEQGVKAPVPLFSIVELLAIPEVVSGPGIEPADFTKLSATQAEDLLELRRSYFGLPKDSGTTLLVNIPGQEAEATTQTRAALVVFEGIKSEPYVDYLEKKLVNTEPGTD